MNRVALVGSALAAILLCILLVLAVLRVRGLMARELDVSGDPIALAAGVEPTLVEVDLLAGDDVTFEVCSRDGMEPARWAGALSLEVEAGAAGARESVLREVVDESMLAGARRGHAGACLDFAHAGSLEVAGHYVVVARSVDARLAGVDLRARVLAERPLGGGDRNAVLAILLGAIVLVVMLALRSPVAARATMSGWDRPLAYGLAAGVGVVAVLLVAPDPRLSWPIKLALAGLAMAVSASAGEGLRRGWTGGGAILGVLGVLELSTLLSIVMPSGPAAGLIAGLGLAGAEVVIAVLAARAFGADVGVLGALGLQRPARTWVAVLGFALAPVAGVLLRLAAMRALALVPSTGEAPIEAYVSWPSGLLSFAALSTIAPVAEEIFFRGLVYGGLRGKGGAANEALAFAGAWLLFVVAHLPQTWGSWGGLLAIAMAGLGFTTLRALSGSVLVAALAHLVYNGLLVVAALAS